MAIERLDWDSSFFGMEVGRLRLKGPVDPAQLKCSLEGSAFDVAYLMVDAPSADQVAHVEEVAPLVDRKLVFCKKEMPRVPPGTGSVTLYDEPATPGLLELVWMSGQYSRFYRDLRFRPYFEDLYAEWLNKSLSGEMADAVYVVRSERSLAGFVTLSAKANVGQVGLIAVHPDARGQGVASSLMSYADEWYTAQGCSEAIVLTQGLNRPACRLYEKSGYHLGSETAVFHWWRE